MKKILLILTLAVLCAANADVCFVCNQEMSYTCI